VANTLVCLVLIGAWLVWGSPDPLGTGALANPTPTPTLLNVLDQSTAAAAVEQLPPTPDCGQQFLTLGETRWRVESLARGADGSIPVPPDSPGTAYHVEDSSLNDLFTLSPNADNLALVSVLQAGMAASFGSESCNTTLYILAAPITGPVDMAALEDQSARGLVVYLPESADSQALTLLGEPNRLIFSGEPTPAPGIVEITAGVAFLESSPASNGASITVSVEVYNYGGQAFTLTQDDVALIPQGGEPLAPSASEPGLPREFKPAERSEFSFTFPNPAGSDAVFKIFTVEFNLADFQ